MMSVPARHLLRVLAVLLLTQWLTGAQAHARAMASAGEDIVICSAEGMRTIRIGPDGEPVTPQDVALSCCQLCPAPAAGGNLASGPALPPPTLVAGPEIALATTARSLALRPMPRIHHSRAPPIS